jgi:DNA-3-methyladenine glycosylase II
VDVAESGHSETVRGDAERPVAAAGEFTIEPVGPFSLRESATFGFGQRSGRPFDGMMRLAFCVDGYREHVGVVLSQDHAGVHGRVHGSADLDAVKQQVARVLSLDHDGDAFMTVGQRDPVVARLLAVAPGLRPPLFHSPYEAAAWSVLSARRPAAQMMALRSRLSEAHGRRFTLAGEQVAAFPLPSQLVDVHEFPGLPADKLDRLHGVAAAAREGLLDADTLRALPVERASSQLQNLAGIGAFYSALILVRATGHSDVLPTNEPQLLDLVAKLYALPAPPGPEQLAEIAEPWKPFRTWVSVLIRAAARRLP